MSKATFKERYLPQYILSSAEGPRPPLAGQIQSNFSKIKITFNKYLPEYYNEILETIFQIDSLSEYEQTHKAIFELMFDTYKHDSKLIIDLAKGKFLKATRELTALFLGADEALSWLWDMEVRDVEPQRLQAISNEMTINAINDEIKHEIKPLIFKFRYGTSSRYLSQFYGNIEESSNRVTYSLANRITICLINIFDGFREQNPAVGKEILESLASISSKEEYEQKFKASFLATISELYNNKENGSKFIKMKEHCLNELVNLMTGQEEAYSRYLDEIDRNWLRTTCREMITNTIADFIEHEIEGKDNLLTNESIKVSESRSFEQKLVDSSKPRSDSFEARIKKEADKGVSPTLL